MKKYDLNHPRFNNVISAPSGEKKYIGRFDNASDEILAIGLIVGDYWRSVEDVLPHLHRYDRYDYCMNIWAFCRSFPVIPERPNMNITLYAPSRVWAFRNNGSEAINIFILCLCLLRAAGFSYNVCKAPEASHKHKIRHYYATIKIAGKDVIMDINHNQFDCPNTNPDLKINQWSK